MPFYLTKNPCIFFRMISHNIRSQDWSCHQFLEALKSEKATVVVNLHKSVSNVVAVCLLKLYQQLYIQHVSIIWARFSICQINKVEETASKFMFKSVSNKNERGIYLLLLITYLSGNYLLFNLSSCMLISMMTVTVAPF